MARAESYSRHTIRKILREHNRTATKYKNYVDSSRTHLNYGYGYSDKSADETYMQILSRCEEIMNGRKMQKQTNVMSEWIVTYPARLCHVEHYDTGKVYTKGKNKGQKIYREYNQPDYLQHCRKFFDTVYSYMQSRYGKDNVIAGYVHMDETTPQIHVCVVPEATSRKTGKRTVSSASLLTRAELHNFHTDLKQEMINVFGPEASDYILNDRTQGAYTIDQLKKRKKDRDVIIIKAKQIKEKEAELKQREEAIRIKESELRINPEDTHDVDHKYSKQNGDKKSSEMLSNNADTPNNIHAENDQNYMNRNNMNMHHRNRKNEDDEMEKELTHERYMMACQELDLTPTSTVQRTL